jgi:hypothetical protein
MKSNIQIFVLCPVPEDQKPINEYIQLKENSFTNWVSLQDQKYLVQLFSFFTKIFTFCSILTISNFQDLHYFFDWILNNILFSLNGLIVILVILLVRWKQLSRKLNKSFFFYEEASWYDGQIWEKPFSILKYDKLLSTQKIERIFHRLNRTIFVICTLDFLFFTLLKFE